MNTYPPNMKATLLARTCLLLLGALTLLGTSLKAAPITVGYSGGSSGATSTPGLEFTLPAITDPSQLAWELTSFTWLSTAGTGALPTGRGYISIFDAALFDPAGMTASEVNSATTGLIARSETYDTGSGEYFFSASVILEGGKSYYFLNSNALSTSLPPVAPHSYGFSTTENLPDVDRWVVSSGTWSLQSGAPNFSAVLEPVSVPEPAASALIGLTALAFAHRRRRH